MPSASLALQASLYAALSTHAPLLAHLGGPHVFDAVPRGREPPYVTFAQTAERDWSTGSEEGSEHVVTLLVWSRAEGRKAALQIVEVLRGLLHGASLPLDGHRLVSLRHELTEVRREPDGETHRGLIRLRAVTEPLV